MKKLLLCTLLLAGTAQAEWVTLSSSDAMTYDGLAGSERVTTNRGGTPIVAITGRSIRKANKTITLEQWYVTTQHCADRQGKLITADMNGEVRGNVEFFFGLGNVASTIAEVVCSFANSDKSAI